MSNLFEKIGSIVVSVGLAIGGFFGYVPEQQVVEAPTQPQEEESLGADTVLPIAGMTFYLAGTGISSSATSFTLTSFAITQNGKKIQDSELSDIFYVTFEPGSRTRQEIVSCTTVVQNADGTATISGCTRGLAPITPYTASTSLQFAHAGGSIVIFSNPPQLYNQVAIKGNDETISGYWDFPTPVAGTNPATKDYVDGVVTGGTLTYDATVIAGIAGDTFATGTVVYLNPTDARWDKADVDIDSTFVNRTIGIAQGSGSDGVSINGGVLTYGIDETQVGMDPGAMQFLSSTAGGTTTATTSQVLGVARGATELFFDTNLLKNHFYGTTTFYGNVEGIGSTTMRVYTASSTWTKPAQFKHIVVEVLAGGGGGGGNADGSEIYAAAGGGAGGYCKSLLSFSDLSGTTSVQVTVGAGGAGGGDTITGDTGGTSWFGNFASSTGGTGGAGNNESDGGSGGSCIKGQLKISGGNGHWSMGDNNQSSQFTATPGEGGSSFFGGEGAPGAGGQGGRNGNGNAGSNGLVIITEYF